MSFVERTCSCCGGENPEKARIDAILAKYAGVKGALIPISDFTGSTVPVQLSAEGCAGICCQTNRHAHLADLRRCNFLFPVPS